MRKTIAVLATLLLACPALAQSRKPANKRPAREVKRVIRHHHHGKAVLKHFDTNKDGKLDAAEQKAMKKALHKRHAAKKAKKKVKRHIRRHVRRAVRRRRRG